MSKLKCFMTTAFGIKTLLLTWRFLGILTSSSSARRSSAIFFFPFTSPSWSQDFSLASQIFPGWEDSFPSFLMRALKSSRLAVAGIFSPTCSSLMPTRQGAAQDLAHCEFRKISESTIGTKRKYSWLILLTKEDAPLQQLETSMKITASAGPHCKPWTPDGKCKIGTSKHFP